MPDWYKTKIVAPQSPGAEPSDILASADGALKIYDAAPDYLQGGSFMFPLKSVDGTDKTFDGEFPCLAPRSWTPIIYVQSASAGNQSTVDIRFEANPTGTAGWYKLHQLSWDAVNEVWTPQPLIYRLVSTASGGVAYYTLPAIVGVNAAYIRAVGTKVGSYNSNVLINICWRP